MNTYLLCLVMARHIRSVSSPYNCALCYRSARGRSLYLLAGDFCRTPFSQLPQKQRPNPAPGQPEITEPSEVHPVPYITSSQLRLLPASLCTLYEELSHPCIG